MIGRTPTRRGSRRCEERQVASAFRGPGAGQGDRPGRGGPRRTGLALDARGPPGRPGRRSGEPDDGAAEPRRLAGAAPSAAGDHSAGRAAGGSAPAPTGRSSRRPTTPTIRRHRPSPSGSGTRRPGSRSASSPAASTRSTSAPTAMRSSPPPRSGIACAQRRPRHRAGALVLAPRARPRPVGLLQPRRLLRLLQHVRQCVRLGYLDVLGCRHGPATRRADPDRPEPRGVAPTVDRWPRTVSRGGVGFIDLIAWPSARRIATWPASRGRPVSLVIDPGGRTLYEHGVDGAVAGDPGFFGRLWDLGARQPLSPLLRQHGPRNLHARRRPGADRWGHRLRGPRGRDRAGQGNGASGDGNRGRSGVAVGPSRRSDRGHVTNETARIWRIAADAAPAIRRRPGDSAAEAEETPSKRPRDSWGFRAGLRPDGRSPWRCPIAPRSES